MFDQIRQLKRALKKLEQENELLRTENELLKRSAQAGHDLIMEHVLGLYDEAAEFLRGQE